MKALGKLISLNFSLSWDKLLFNLNMNTQWNRTMKRFFHKRNAFKFLLLLFLHKIRSISSSLLNRLLSTNLRIYSWSFILIHVLITVRTMENIWLISLRRTSLSLPLAFTMRLSNISIQRLTSRLTDKYKILLPSFLRKFSMEKWWSN